MITHEQYLQLLRPINGRRVSKDGKGFSHVEAYEIRAHLNRIFGFLNWDEEVTDQQVVFETCTKKNDREVWTVCYRSIVRLTVRCPDGCHQAVYTEGACGDAANQPSHADAHDLALKTSQSQAFKRAAVNLGDQFGASLYNKGSLMPLVGKSLVHPDEPDVPEEGEEPGASAPVDAHITAPLAPEVEPETPAREVSSPTPPHAPEADQPPASDSNGEPVKDQTYVLDRIRAAVTFSATADPAMKMRGARAALDMANEFGLMNRPTTDGRTIGAWLTATLQQAHAEIAAAAVEQS